MKNIYRAVCIVLITVSAALASPRVGQRPDGICTRDLNLWGHAGQCSCLEESVYDERAGLCLEGDEAEQIMVQGALTAGMAAIGGETTGFAIETSEEDFYELILRLDDQKKLSTLSGMSFEAEGELIIIDSVGRKGRQVVIVDQLFVLE